MKSSVKIIFILLSLITGVAEAAVCTSLSAGRWNQAARWSCGNIPSTTDTVAINNNVQMRNNYTIAGLTIDAGAVLDSNGSRLTVQGNVVNKGVFGTSVGNGNGNGRSRLIMDTVGTSISGIGTFANARLYVDAITITLSAGSNMSFTSGADIRVGSNNSATLLINGTVTGTALVSGSRIISVNDNNASTVVINGTVNAPNSYVEVQRGGTVTNNGTVILQYLDGDRSATATWTQGANSSLTLSQPTQSWVGTFNASATGNTVVFNGTATPFNPMTYYNIGGTNVVCPLAAGITVLGASSCMPANACMLPWGGFITNGFSTPAYSVGSVPTGSSCPAATTRTCTTGTLSGTGNFASCVVAPPAPCGGGLPKSSVAGGSLGLALAGLQINSAGRRGTTTINNTTSGTSVISTVTAPVSGNNTITFPGAPATSTNTTMPALQPATFPALTGATNLTNPATVAVNTAATSYGRINVKKGVTVFAGGITTPTYIKKLTSAAGTTLQFAPGDYYIDSITVGGNLTVSPSGLVRLFIGTQQTGTYGKASSTGGDNNNGFQTNSRINTGGNPANLQLLLYSRVTYFEFSNGTQFTGIMYQPAIQAGAPRPRWGQAPGQFDLHSGVNITGSLYTPGIIETWGNNVFNYTPQVAAAIANFSTCPPSAGLNHFEIQHAGGGLGVTCTPSTLTIKACSDAAVPCVVPYTAGISGTLSATGTPTVNWLGGTGFTIPAGSSTVVKDVQVTTVGSVVLDATSIPAPVAATACNFGTPGCTFTSVDSVLLVSAPNHLSESVSALTIQAVKSAPGNPLVCIAGMTGAKTVNLKCAYSDPVTGTLPVRVGGTALNATDNAVAACGGTGANVSLTFNASGIATPTLQYADVGKMSVIATYTGITGTLDAGLSMTGTGSFITVPASFAFSGITVGTIKAGNPFSATMSSLNSAGAVTPNFGKETTAQGVTLTSTLVTPNPVTYPTAANPVPGNNVISGAEFGAGGMVNDANGVATVNNLSWGEVGSIVLNASLTGGNYLGSGLTATGMSATTGPFIPDHFDTAVVATATTPMPCPTGLTCPLSYNGFVYSGQPFSMQVKARNQAGGTTTNYSSAFGLSNNVTLTAWDALGSVVTQNPAGGALAIKPMLSTTFVSGVGLLSTQAYTFATSPTLATDIFLRAVDAVNASVTSLRATPATSVEGGVKVVSGKVKISNAYGSELLPLPMTVTVQYWNGTSWLTSATDNATQFNTNLSTAGGSIVTTIVSGLGGGVSVVTPGVVTVAGGVQTFTLNKPGVVGSADISLNAPAYLLGGSNGAGINPSKVGRATFGVYKGPSEFIYLRENY